MWTWPLTFGPEANHTPVYLKDIMRKDIHPYWETGRETETETFPNRIYITDRLTSQYCRRSFIGSSDFKISGVPFQTLYWILSFQVIVLG